MCEVATNKGLAVNRGCQYQDLSCVLNVEMFRQVIRQTLVITVWEGSIKCTAKLIAVISKEVLSKNSFENPEIFTRMIIIH
jgi:hypothetical protein